MNFVFANEFEELAQSSRKSPAYQGQATLSSWPINNSLVQAPNGILAAW